MEEQVVLEQHPAASGAPPAPPPTMAAAVPPSVKLGLTAAYTLLYALLFSFVYVQLWLVLRYGHKRCSYQTAFLLLCLLWAALRALLFSFHFRDCRAAGALPALTFWLLYGFPVCLQFFTLGLMNLYCAQVYFKAKSKLSPALLRYRLPLYLLFFAISLLFLLVNLVCALLVKMAAAEVKTVVLVRVAVNDSLFVLCAVSLSICLHKVAKMSLANIHLESKVRWAGHRVTGPSLVCVCVCVQGTSVCQVTLIGVTVVMLYASRACYNLVVLSLSDVDDWYNVSDQADLRSSLGDGGYVVFGAVLFVWELLPTSLVVFFFRVRRPPQDRGAAGVPNHGLSARGYFFDNPRRYDSDDDLAWSIPAHNASGSLSDWSSRHSSFSVHAGEHLSAAAGELQPYP